MDPFAEVRAAPLKGDEKHSSSRPSSAAASASKDPSSSLPSSHPSNQQRALSYASAHPHKDKEGHPNSNHNSSHASNSSSLHPSHSQSPRINVASSSSSSSSSDSKSKLVGPTQAAIAATFQKKSEPVYLNVYDLHPYNQYLHGLGFGAYHSAVQIFGREYSFGFHNGPETGVFSMMPKNVPNAVFREQIEAGHIYLTYNQFNLILNQMKAEWTGNKYHLLKRNCNHFSKALLAALGLKAPSFINRLASAGDMLAAVVPSFMLPKQVNALIKDGRPDMGQQQDEQLLGNIPSARQGAVPVKGKGVPNLSDGFGNNATADLVQGDWRQIAPAVAGGGGGGGGSNNSSFSEADSLDEESFEEFLRQSEREYQREQQLRQLKQQTNQATEEAQIQEFQNRMKRAAKQEAASAASSSKTKNGEDETMTAYSSAFISPLKEKKFEETEGSRTARENKASPLPFLPASKLSPAEQEEDAREAKVEQALREFNLGSNVSEEEKQQIRAVLRMSISAGAE